MDPTTPPTPPVPPATGTASTGTPPASSGASGTQFNIPQAVLDKYPELVEMIKKTESMTDEEREYWFQILPIMTEDQVTRLKNILSEEAAQLAKLDDQYQSELTKLNQKHLDEWSNFQRKQDREGLEKAEAQHEAAEAKAQEELLKQLDEPTPPTPPASL